MKKKNTIKYLDNKKQDEMQTEIKQVYGDTKIREQKQKFNTLNKEQQQQVLNECNEIFELLAEHIHKDPYSDEVRELLIQWHNWLRNFYEPSMELLQGLGEMYASVPDFRETFEKIDSELPDFLPKAINCYVEELEEKWLQEQYNVLEH